MTSSGDEGATYCCCSWKRLPRALKWAIIGCSVVMLASFIGDTVYLHAAWSGRVLSARVGYPGPDPGAWARPGRRGGDCDGRDVP